MFNIFKIFNRKNRKPEFLTATQFSNLIDYVFNTEFKWTRDDFILYTVGNGRYSTKTCSQIIGAFYDFSKKKLQYELEFYDNESKSYIRDSYEMNKVISYDKEHSYITGVFDSKASAVKAYGEYAARDKAERIKELEFELMRLKGEK